jgi:hypothetical protein
MRHDRHEIFMALILCPEVSTWVTARFTRGGELVVGEASYPVSAGG